jgi:ubiquinone/menaquinone biosynthesis C-methylase UbiE
MKPWSGERLETFFINETTIEHLHRYAIACELSEDKVVVDIACGEGYGSNLISTVAKTVIGIDIDGATINKAKEKYKSPNLSFYEGSAEKIPLADSIADVVVSFETIEHLVDHDTMLSEIKRILKQDGILIISTPDKKYYSEETGYKNPYHKKEFYKEEFYSFLEKYFSYTDMYLQFCGGIFKIIAEGKNITSRYEGTFDTLTSKKNIAHKYLIAIASNKEIIKIEDSDFKPGEVFFNAGTKHILDSYTYKTGNFVLSPFKFLKNIFKGGK